MGPIGDRVLRLGGLVGLAVLIGYGGMTGAIFFGQRGLQYFPARQPPPPPPSGAVNLVLRTSDDMQIHAWAGTNTEATRGVVMLHGNGGHRGGSASAFAGFRRLGIRPVLIDYRGYGGSEGTPTEEGLYRDAQAAWDWLRSEGIDDIVIWGRSLGTGVAVELAIRNEPSAVILEAPFDSAVQIGTRSYPWLPVSLLMQDRYESDLKIGGVRCPLLVIHGTRDLTIPIEHGARLYQLANEPKTWLQIEGAGHNDVEQHAGTRYWNAVEDTLRGHEG